MKKLILILLILFSSFAFADSISNYQVKESVPLEKLLTVTGTFNADSNANVLCKFLVLESDGNTVMRLSDEYTFSDGSFYTEKRIIEPQLRRGQDYNVTTTCGTVSATDTFSVVNREQIVDVFAYEFLFFKENGFVLFIGLLGIVVIAIIAGVFARAIWTNFFQG